MPHGYEVDDAPDCTCIVCLTHRMYDKKCRDYDALQVLVTDLQRKLTEAKARILNLELELTYIGEPRE